MLADMCGSVLASKASLPRFWLFMYYTSPLTYLISSMFSTAVAKTDIECSQRELLEFQSPNGQTCGQYLAPFLKHASGSLLNPGSFEKCRYCPLHRTDDFLNTLNVKYGDRWWQYGLQWLYIVFNILCTFALYRVARARKTAQSP